MERFEGERGERADGKSSQPSCVRMTPAIVISPPTTKRVFCFHAPFRYIFAQATNGDCTEVLTGYTYEGP